MPKIGKKASLLLQYNEDRASKLRNLPVVKQIIDLMVFAYNIIVEGLIFFVVKRVFTHNIIEIPTKNEFYKAHKKISLNSSKWREILP